MTALAYCGRPGEPAVLGPGAGVAPRVVGFGLDGDETNAPGQMFAEAFAIARGGGVLAVPHAGELTAGALSAMRWTC
jgi:adenosine deaminase